MLSFYKMENLQSKTRGGYRLNSGRKSSGIKKTAFTLYIENSILESKGKVELRKSIYNHLNQIKDDTGKAV